MKIMLVISYDGSKFNGFQRQKNVRNVQGEIERALSKIYGCEILIKGSGRTDAKVHAKYQVIHYETNKNIIGIKGKLNKILKDIKVKKKRKVDNNFHARGSVKNKIYLYKLDISGKRDKNYYGIYCKNLDIKKMKDASTLFIGTHDFHNFSSGDKNSFETTIEKINIYKIGSVIYFRFKGYAFYRYMVRNLVGALLEVGKNKINYNIIKDMLDTKEDTKRLPTASPSGLYLIKVNY